MEPHGGLGSRAATTPLAGSEELLGLWALSAYHAASPAVTDRTDGAVKRVVFATRTATALILAEELWQALLGGEVAALPEEAVQVLAEAELLVPRGEEELPRIVERNQAAAQSSRTYTLVVQPTAFCQMGCVYCGQAHSRLRMAADLQDRLLDHVAQRLDPTRYDHLEVSWFGAEPLAALESLRSLSNRLQALARDRGCTYAASMTTNGLRLSAGLAEELVRDHALCSVTVTLDGMAGEHDVRRPLKNGRGTFQKVIDNLAAVGAVPGLPLDIRVRTNVDRENWHAVPELIRHLAARGLAGRVQYYTVPVHSWGNDAQDRSLDPIAYAGKELEWLCLQMELGFTVGLLPALRPIVCIAVRPEGDVVDATGGLFNSTEVSYVPAYGTPNQFAVGAVGTAEEADRRAILGGFNDRVLEGDLPCASCVMLPVCGGACPKSWLEGHTPCPSAKDNIEARLLLDFARSRIHSDAPAAAAAG